MADARLEDVAGYLDEYLRIHDLADAPNARNGLQVENAGSVTRIGAAVDASARTIGEAARLGCDLLLVHHGLYWDGDPRVTARRYRRLKPLLDHGIAVYSAHLPLDAHEDVGNNAVLARALGIEIRGRFAGGVGVWGDLDVKRETLAARLDDVLGRRVHMMLFGPDRTARVGVLTGGGGGLIGEALSAGLDAYVTGEGPHHTHFDAEEGSINVYYGGHYATETWGVKALAAHLAQRYGLPWEFIDHPTGL
ncbi:MAG: Nif3-like dinuclear metal center hexameric protein [Gemmatimonadota bacterium]